MSLPVSHPFYVVTQAVEAKVQQHGSLRAAARAMQVTAAYLCRIRSGEKQQISDRILKKLGVVRIVTYRWAP